MKMVLVTYFLKLQEFLSLKCLQLLNFFNSGKMTCWCSIDNMVEDCDGVNIILCNYVVPFPTWGLIGKEIIFPAILGIPALSFSFRQTSYFDILPDTLNSLPSCFSRPRHAHLPIDSFQLFKLCLKLGKNCLAWLLTVRSSNWLKCEHKFECVK